MLQRVEQNGCVFYLSPLLARAGVPHAFSTRIGGVSSGPFASLNLGNPSDSEIKDTADNIATNYRRLHEAIGCADRARCFVHQVHGCAIANASNRADFTNNRPADALVSNAPAQLLAIRTADCIPILLATDDGRFVAAVHAGWRGIVANIIQHAGDELRRIAGSTCAKLLAAIGPCISKPHFEVGPEVLSHFEQAFGSTAPIDRSPDGKGHVDLPRAAYLQLLACGLSPDHIDITDRCTFRDADEFFSHRRDRGVTGRMAALVGVRDHSAQSQPS
jgi:YfiH family protein